MKKELGGLVTIVFDRCGIVNVPVAEDVCATLKKEFNQSEVVPNYGEVERSEAVLVKLTNNTNNTSSSELTSELLFIKNSQITKCPLKQAK